MNNFNNSLHICEGYAEERKKVEGAAEWHALPSVAE